ncbi:Transcriptional regulatory protein FixJ [Candidatus Terasakiella magnetica]|uniref:Transcriptional regulatory protein FixJ n=1 Tax=Candidatus Terasakiella magnetica TaxID=1867952 RepID=A0A1C3RK35_9PROT|nr:response regulator [Candidatus Terasakiella magnetica]SCA57638.1 Transcriptional regulatory protein FixJ [Candidatus Terasakiella magnetica]
MAAINVYLVDDDQDLLDYLETAMTTDQRKVHTYASASQFLSQVDNIPQTGCVVLDVNMPEMDGLELQKKLNEMKFPLPIVFLTAHAEVPMAVQAMQAGAVDFIQKPVQPDELIACVDRVSGTPQKNLPSAEEAEIVKKTVDELTPREREVMDLIVKGASNKEAAQSLDISPRTVEIYRATVMRKMDAPNLPDLVRKAIAIGM